MADQKFAKKVDYDNFMDKTIVRELKSQQTKVREFLRRQVPKDKKKIWMQEKFKFVLKN